VTGSITFQLFGPDNQTCDQNGKAPVCTPASVPVNGNRDYSTPTACTVAEEGTYHWMACYSGDANNKGVCSICANEAVVIGKKPPCTGECPYIGIVGNDCVKDIDSSSNPDQPCVAIPFYFSDKHQQFLFDQEAIPAPVCWPEGIYPKKSSYTRVPVPPVPSAGCEQFRSNKPINQPEICDAGGTVVSLRKGIFEFEGERERNAVITKQNAGWFEWWIRLPLKPSGEINICIQCGVLKPNAFSFGGFQAIEECAAETGERVGTGCTHNQVAAGKNPIVNAALPKITAIAYPGPWSPYFDADFPNDPIKSPFKPFHLTAYKNPGTYNLSKDVNDLIDDESNNSKKAPMTNSASLQILDGSTDARILLKACMDKCVIAKIPVTGQVNKAGETEYDLERGDLIYVRMDVPVNNTVDIYCHSQSAKIAGIGEPF